MKYTAKNILLAAVQVTLLVMNTDLIAQNVVPVPAAPRPTPVASFDPQADWVTKFFELKNVDANAMNSILVIFRADVAVPSAVGGRYRIISVRAPKEIMPAIEDTIARFDVPPPPAPARPPIKSIEVSVQVLGAYDGTVPTCPTCAIPTALQPVITQLQKNFTYKAYLLLDSQLYRQTSGTSLSSVNSLAAMNDYSATYTINWSSANVTPDSTSISLYSLKFGADVRMPGRDQSTHFGFDTSMVLLPPDQQIVIGKTTVGTTTVFLVVRAKVVD